MKKYITFIEKAYPTHSHKTTTIKILTLLEYVEEHLEEVLAEHGQADLFRHPHHHMALHIGQYPNPKALRDYLLNLSAEVRGCFEGMMALHQTYPKNDIFGCFLANINDSTVGFMEVRLRNALNFAGLVQSAGGVIPFTTLMEGFQQSLTIPNLLLHFGEFVEHHLPILMILQWGSWKYACGMR